MACRLVAVCFAAQDPARLARFWSGLLGWEPAAGATLLPPDDTGFRIGFVATDEPKTSQNHAHFDLTSTSPDDQHRTVARALELGGRHVDVGQTPDDGHVVLGDPEGNEFCVIEPGNAFLAGCGFVGALACDGSQDVGYFWSAALGWPLVWDRDQETAIRSPHGGPKLTWGGWPPVPGPGRDRVHLDLAPAPGDDQRAEIDRLVSLGATLGEGDRHGDGRVTLLDPDGTGFCLSATSAQA